MASPEIIEPSGALDSSFQEELSAPEGWKKKLMMKKAGTPKKKDVVYVAPDGEEIKSKRQLEKYLKAHPGGPSPADFDWTTGGTPRRSARLSSKGRISGEGGEAEPVAKRSKSEVDEETVVVSPRKASKRRSGSGKDEVMEDAGKGEEEHLTGADGSGELSKEGGSAGDAKDENNTAEGGEKEDVGEVKLGEPAKEEVPSTGDKELRGCDTPKQSGVGKLEEIEATRSHDIPSKAAHGSWDATDSSHVLAVKAALHLSALPDKIICRESESSKVIKFCKTCLTEERAGSIYICGCPGTGKSLTIEKVKLLSTMWSKEAGKTRPNMVSINSTSLTDPSKIYLRVLQGLQSKHDNDNSSKSNDFIMRELKRFLCASPGINAQSSKRMVLLIVDEMDYLISRDQSVLYELFRLSTFANSRLILIGIANAIDLTDRLLPKLRSMNCKVDVVTFPAYTKDQILAVLQQRLSALPYPVFQPAALELCARKVAAASGDMRKALHVCRSAVELVEAKAHASRSEEDCQLSGNLASLGDQELCTAVNLDAEAGDNWKERSLLVGIEIMAKILSRVFRSPVMETIQALPRHQQMVLCAAVCRFRRGRKDCNLGELNTGYLKFCKTTGMQPLTTPEFSSVCQVLADQALLCLGTSREDRLRRVTLKVDEEDVILALQGVRFLRACLP